MTSEMGTEKTAERMTLSTAGKQLVWVVFENDGCECANLVGIFGIEKDAISCRDNIEAAIHRQYVHMNEASRQRYPLSTEMEWMGSVTVQCREIGQIDLPADAAAAPPVAEREP